MLPIVLPPSSSVLLPCVCLFCLWLKWMLEGIFFPRQHSSTVGNTRRRVTSSCFIPESIPPLCSMSNHYPLIWKKAEYGWRFYTKALFVYNDDMNVYELYVFYCYNTTQSIIVNAHYSLPPLLPPPLVPVCLVLALRPPGARCWPLLWPRDVEFGLEMVLSSCSMEHRSAIRASRSTVSPWFNASAGSNRSDIEKEQRKGEGFKDLISLIFLDLCCHYTDLDHCQWDGRGLTVYVVHWEAIGEVGHVCLLSERRLLQRLLGPAIIQTLQSTHRHIHSKHEVHIWKTLLIVTLQSM